MARYNTVSNIATVASTTTLGTPQQGLFTEIPSSTGAGFTINLPSPGLYPGIAQTYFNNSTYTVTLSTPSGTFVGPGASASSTQSLPPGATLVVVSDGTRYVQAVSQGGAVSATSLTATGNITFNGSGATVGVTPSGVVTISPTGAGGRVVISSPTANSTPGALDNMVIGANTAQSAAFTTATASTAIAYNSSTTTLATTAWTRNLANAISFFNGHG
jgi:hypothetical protein